jgi:pimeloyl-ACP methyl ester carboxylesterase
MRGKNMKKLVFGLIAIGIFCSCKTVSNNHDPYENMSILKFGNNTAYEFLNNDSDKLIILIDGTRWVSVLGWKEEDNWDLSSSSFFLDIFREKYNFMIPERLNMQIGKYYLYDPDMRRNYTLNNLVESYSLTINKYLDERNLSSVVIIGHSEGASLLPLIYNEIKQKSKISGMIAISYGGLSVYEQVKILANTELNIPDYYREALQNIDVLKMEIELYPNSLGEIMGYTYGWWNSFLNYRPYDFYTNINIPILFVHGRLDTTVPVESTQYIQEKLSNKPFEYAYVDSADHSFDQKESKDELIKIIDSMCSTLGINDNLRHELTF